MPPKDIWNEPTAKAWVRHVLEEMVPKLRGSALVCSMVPTSPEGDVKFWVELGASIMMDKPIVAVVLGDVAVSTKLVAVADEVVRCPRGAGPEAAAEIQAAITRVVERLGFPG